MLYICDKFREIISNGIKVMERTWMINRWQMDGWTDGWTDTQKFGGYNIIPHHFLWRGIKILGWWIGEALWFTYFSTVFQSYPGNEMGIKKGSVPWNIVKHSYNFDLSECNKVKVEILASPMGLYPGTARWTGQHLITWATGARQIRMKVNHTDLNKKHGNSRKTGGAFDLPKSKTWFQIMISKS